MPTFNHKLAKAQKAKGGFLGGLGGAALGGIGLASGVVGPLAIPIGLAAGGTLGKMFG